MTRRRRVRLAEVVGVDLFGAPVTVAELASTAVHTPRSGCMHKAPADSAYTPLTAAAREELEWIARKWRTYGESRWKAPSPLPGAVFDARAIVAARFAEAASKPKPGLPQWLTRLEPPIAETGAGAIGVCTSLRPQSEELASSHSSVLTRVELPPVPKSLEVQGLRASVQNSLRAIFPRRSNRRKCRIRRHCGQVETRVKKADGRESAFLSGLVRCGSVWSCPTCAAVISGQRARIVCACVQEHRRFGGAVYMLTLTVRHNVSMPLRPLRRTVSAALQKMQQGSPWKRFRESVGFVGSVAAREVTIGNNGYHPHVHMLLFVRHELSPVELREFEDDVYAQWSSAVDRVAELRGVLPDREHGVKLSPCDEHAADYIQKLGLAAEITRGSEKKAKGENRTPFEVARDWHEEHDGRDAHVFRRYDRGMKGARQLTWSRGKDGRYDLRKLYAQAIESAMKLDTLPDQPTLAGFETDEEIMRAEEHRGAVVGQLNGPMWDAYARVMRADGRDPEFAMRVAALTDGANGIDGLLGYARARGAKLAETRRWLRKWLRLLDAPDPLPAELLPA